MAGGVQHRLLSDAHQLMFDVRGIPLRHAAHAEFQFDRLIGSGARRALAKRVHEVAGFESR